MIDSKLSVRADPSSPNTGEPTLTQLISGIMDDAVKLMRQQVDMLQAEVREDVGTAKKAAQFGAVAVVLLTVGMQALVLGAGFFLAWAFPDMPLWSAFLIMGVVTVAIGTGFLLVAKQVLAHFTPIPEKTITSLKENFSWKT